MKNGVRTESASLVLTFNKPDLPEKITAGYLSLPVTQWIPPPLRCYRCQIFGHSSTDCEKPELCPCGNPPHEGSACPEQQTCANCNGPHSARSNQCPTYKTEMAIQRLRITERLSYPEAKQRICGNTRSFPRTSYANAVATSTSPQNGLNVKDLVAALVPELCRALGLVPKVSESSSSPKTAPPTQHSSSSTSSLKNPVPTAVLQRQASLNASTSNTKKKDHFDSSKVSVWFDQDNEKTRSRSRSNLKRNKTKAASSTTSAGSAGDEQYSLNIDGSGSSSGTLPVKRKPDLKSRGEQSSDADSECDMEAIFDPVPRRKQNARPLKELPPEEDNR